MNLVNSVRIKPQLLVYEGCIKYHVVVEIITLFEPTKNLGTILQQHKESTEKAIKSRINSISFDSALSNYIFENPNHYFLFDETILISNDLEIKQTVCKAIKIK